MTTEQLPPVGGGEDPIWDRPPPPPSGVGGKIALAVALLVVVALAGLGIGWMLAAVGGGSGSTSGATPPSTAPAVSTPPASARPTPTKGSDIEAGRTTDFGYFLSSATTAGATHITFDRAQLLIGQAAEDYAKSHHMPKPQNGYLLLNVNPKTRDLVLGPEVAVTGTRYLANSSQPVPVSLQTLLDALPTHGKQMPLDVRYDAHGLVVAVSERYFP